MAADRTHYPTPADDGIAAARQENGGLPNCEELVDESSACPECGERRIDWLVWQDDEQVRCETCGTVYEP